MKLFIVSGRSGSGKTIALRVLEDLGFYCVDNLPVSFLPDLVGQSKTFHDKLAVSIDIRNVPTNPEALIDFYNGMKSSPTNEVVSIFLDADDQTLIHRYEETRRLHPLAKSMKLTLEEAIKTEHQMLDSMAGMADIRIDTSTLSIHQLSETINTIVLGKKEKDLVIIFESFGFKYGTPKDADFVFDARFLPNPHWVPELRPLTGLDIPVKDFFRQYQEMSLYIQQIDAMLFQWLPYLERNNRSYLTVAIGCTGGQHRSVYIAQELADRFKDRNKAVHVKHININSSKVKK
ncbi:MAG: RNase adapter RapZ [Succinivibrionaceae bacterium]|nr:RNase adapter RapZ [Succinivibrionaceae bacterium]